MNLINENKQLQEIILNTFCKKSGYSYLKKAKETTSYINYSVINYSQTLHVKIISYKFM